MKSIQDRGKLPSKKAEDAQAQASELKEKIEQKDAELRGAIARLSATPDGKFFLTWLRLECGFGNSYLAFNNASQTIDKEMTTYQAIRLNLWWKIRKYLPIKNRIEIED